MFLYDPTTNIYYLGLMAPHAAYYPGHVLQSQMPSLESLVPQPQNTQCSAQEIPEIKEKSTKKGRPRSKTAPQKKVFKPSHKKNIRNIIPNLARKILSFICSEDSRQCLEQCFPSMAAPEIEEYYKFAQQQKCSLSFYIGNKDLARIWYDPLANPQFLKVARILSKQFLQKDCINSILLSRRMKPSLKIEHLRYRHRIIKILYAGPKKASEQTA